MSSTLEEKLESDLRITRAALDKVKIAVPSRSYAKRIADDFLGMARAYYEDALHFRDQGELVDSFACVNYAHGWLDAGARLGVLDTGNDDQLFTLL